MSFFVTPAVGQPGARPPQLARFEQLMADIAAQRDKLGAWQQATTDYYQQQTTVLGPLLATVRGLDIGLLRFLDHASHGGDLGRTDLALLHALVRDFAASLLQQGQDAGLKEILARHQDEDEAEDAREGAAKAAAAPVEPSTPDTASSDDWMHEWQQMEAAQADAAQQRERQRAQRKAASRRARQQAQPQQADASQSIRDVYRKLASALHPDREQDLTERERKTTLMQRVNQAYAAKNLLDLLQLQLEIEQIDVKSIQTMGEARLRRYNEVLAEQLADLQKETVSVERALRTQLGLGHGAELTPTRMTRALKEQARGLQQDIAYYRMELKELEDPRTLKRWLREQRG
jgi:hypothetical protein